MELQYCIICEHYEVFPSHIVWTPNGGWEDDWDYCNGPFASCPPPPMTEDYWEWLFEQAPMD